MMFTVLPAAESKHSRPGSLARSPSSLSSDRPDHSVFQTPLKAEAELSKSKTQLLCDIWQDCLEYSPAQPEDDFFAKGGHLRSAARAVRLIRSMIVGHERSRVTVDVLHQHRTPQALGAALGDVELSASSGVPSSRQLTFLPAQERCTAQPASPAQLRMWLLQQQRPNSWDYNVPAFFDVRGPVAAVDVRSAVVDAVRRHESLRTTFAMGADGQLMQVVHPAEKADQWDYFKSFDLRSMAPSEREAELKRLVDAHARTRFDCERGPLLAAFYAELAPEHGHLGFVVHHSVFDGTSGALVVRELAMSALGQSLPPPAVQYAEFASWQLQQLREGACDDDFAYWQQQLRDIEPLQLPLDRPRAGALASKSADAAPSGRSLPFSWPAELTAQVAAAAKQHGVTTYVFLAAAFSSVLQRWANSDEVVLGTAMAGRPLRAFDSVCGMFVNTVALRTGVPTHRPFAELLESVRRRVYEAFDHQAAPFEEVVRRVGATAGREAGRHPLFDVFFAYQSGDAAPFFDQQTVGPLTLSRDYWHGDVSQMDVSLTMWRHTGRLAGSLEYNSDLFDASTVQRMLENLRVFIEAAVADTTQAVGAIPMLSQADKDQLLSLGLIPRDGKAECIHDLFEAQARRTPDELAIDFEGTHRVTYAQLSAQSNSLGRRLRRMGVGKESLVGIYMDKSVEAYLSILAVLKTGGCYTTLDPEHPSDRTQFMLEDSGLRLVLTVSAFAAKLFQAVPGGSEIRVLAIDTDKEWESESSDAMTDVTVTPDQMAYMIYTSGTTGRPKGVCVEHRNVYNIHLNGAVNCRPGDRYFAFLALSFDPHMDDFRAAVFNGGTLCCASRATMLNNLSGLLGRMKITHVAVTPSVAAVLDPALVLPGGLRVLIVGGEPMTAAIIARWSSLVSLYNIYGPTENTICCMTKLCAPQTSQRNIGRPYVNCAAYILNEQLQPVPAGSVGELCFGGPQVARGYWGRPELTAEKFIADPFRRGVDPSARMFKTGDLARFMPDGTIECLGRRDTQVKLRGNRIELGEIESVLLEMDGIKRAAVVLQQLPQGPALVAYVVPSTEVPDQEASAFIKSALRHCQARLTSYMVPSHVMILQELPLTTSGKLDTRALRKPSHHTLNRTGSTLRERVAPRNAVERALLAAYEEVLALPADQQQSSLSVDDDFFAVGGHSLLAMQLVGLVRTLHGDRLRLSLPMLFDLRTVAAIAQALIEAGCSLDGKDEENEHEQKDASTKGAAATAVQKKKSEMELLPRAETLPEPAVRSERGFRCAASNGQARLWIVQQNDPSSAAYNVPSFFRFEGRLDLDRLQAVATQLVQRHEILRTTLEMNASSGVLEQVVHGVNSAVSRQAGRLDVSSGPAADISAYSHAEASRAFDLSTGPLVRFAVRTLADGPGGVFSLVAHHAALDGWSCALLLRELQVLWAGSAPVASAPVQYADFSELQRQALVGPRLEASAAYWRDNLAAMQPLELPLDKPRSNDGRPSPTGHVKLSLPPAVVDQLEALAKQSNTSLFTVVTAGLMTVLHRWSGEAADVPLGAVLSGRAEARLAPIVGFFANTVVLRGLVQAKTPFKELLERVRTTVLAAMDHQAVPFDRVVKESGAERRVGRNPLFDVMLVFQSFEGAERLRQFELPSAAPSDVLRPMPAVQMQGMDVHPTTAKADLVVDVWQSNSEITVTLEYAADLWLESTARRFGSHLKRLLKSVARGAAAVEQPVALLPMLGRRELKQIEEWSLDVEDFGTPMCVHEMFEAQARRTPDNIAILFENHLTLTYAELSRRSNQLARQLRARGVGVESLIGVYMDKSLEVYISILAILKAGGCYVPLDPEHPPERTQFMLEDTAARLVITQSAFADKVRQAIAGVQPRESGAGTAAAVQLLVLDEEARWDEWDAAPLTDVGVKPHNLCYGIFTSGTTGRPKGVMQQHDMLFNELMHDRPVLNLPVGTRWFAFASITFDVSAHDFFMPTSVGGTVCCASKQLMLDNLPGLINDMKVNVLALTSSVALVLDPRKLPTVHTMLCAGEPMTNAIINNWCPYTRVINDYGPTEVFICTEAHCRVGACTLSIGRPLKNVEVRLLNELRQPVPVGSLGEIYFGGVQVARGYLNRPDLTAARFISNPFRPADHPCSRLYMTGDLGRFMPDGSIECIGRRDTQVKLRGNRIELGEIESVMLEMPGVKRAAVILQQIQHANGTGGQPRLVAYVVPNDGAESSSSTTFEESAERESSLVNAILAQCRQRLASYMVPSHVILMDKLPLTSSGKLDTRALPKPTLTPTSSVASSTRSLAPSSSSGSTTMTTEDGDDSSAAAASGPGERPNRVEEAMCVLARDLLTVYHVGPNDDFFDLGGNSLLAFTLITRLRELHPGLVGVSIRHLMQFHTMRGLLQHVYPQAFLMQDSSSSDSQTLTSTMSFFGNEEQMIEELPEGGDEDGEQDDDAEDEVADLPLQAGLDGTSPKASRRTTPATSPAKGAASTPGKSPARTPKASTPAKSPKSGASTPARTPKSAATTPAKSPKSGAATPAKSPTRASRHATPTSAKATPQKSPSVGSASGGGKRMGQSPSGKFEKAWANHYAGVDGSVARSLFQEADPELNDALPDIVRLALQWMGMILVIGVSLAGAMPLVLYLGQFTFVEMGNRNIPFLLPIYFVSSCFLQIALTVFWKWVLIGRYKEGRHSIDSWFFVRFWTVHHMFVFTNALFLRWFVDTPVLSFVYRLLGARIGSNARIGAPALSEWDLVEVGDDVSVGAESTLQPCTFEGRHLVLRRVKVGDRCTVGVRCHVFGGTTMEPDCELVHNSSAQQIYMPAGTCWHGAQAQQHPTRKPAAPVQWTSGQRAAYHLMQLLLLVFVVLPTQSCSLAPNWLIVRVYILYTGTLSYVVSAAFTFSFWLLPFGIVFTCITSIWKWLLLGRLPAGETREYTPWLAARLWVFDQMLLAWPFEVFTQWFLNDGRTTAVIMRMFGAKVGKGAFLVAPRLTADIDLLRAGDNVVSGGQVFYYGRQRDGNKISFPLMQLEDNTMLGGRAVVLGGALVREGATVGECTASDIEMPPHSIFIGSPATELVGSSQSRSAVKDPVLASVVLARAYPNLVPAMGMLSAIITPLLVPLSAAPSAALFYFMNERYGFPWSFVWLPLVLVMFYFTLGLVTLLVKRLIIGRFYGDWTIFSRGFLRWIFCAHVARLRDNLVDRMVRGTPAYPWWLRLNGAKVGKRVHMEGLMPIELDLLDIGDNAVVAPDTMILPHVIDSGELQFSRVRIGENATISQYCTIMPGATIGDGTQVRAGSIVMKHEKVPDETVWVGNPLSFVSRTRPVGVV